MSSDAIETQPIEESYPTIVLQFKSANGNLPPDMEMNPSEIALFLAQGIAMVNEKEMVQCDISFGKTGVAQYEVLADVLESTKPE